jgi:Flp pilus assembly protein TadD
MFDWRINFSWREMVRPQTAVWYTAALLKSAVCASLIGCAIPRSQSAFKIEGEAGQRPFATSEELRTAGLASEAMLLAKSSRYSDSVNRFRQALYLEPANAKLKLDLAFSLQQAGQRDEAEQLFRELYQAQPRNPAILVGYAEVLISLRRGEEGKGLLKDAFRLFIGGTNDAQAARIARSISNVVFGLGDEAEALCYSYEAWMLDPTPDQLAAHARLLTGLNLFQQADTAVVAAVKQAQRMKRSAAVQHARALALFGSQQYQQAVEAEDLALQYLSKDPQLGAEVAAVRWLALSKIDRTADTEVEIKRFNQQRQEVQDFAERAGYEVIFWPLSLVEALYEVKALDDHEV